MKPGVLEVKHKCDVNNVRHITFLSEVDHGRATLVDNLTVGASHSTPEIFDRHSRDCHMPILFGVAYVQLRYNAQNSTPIRDDEPDPDRFYFNLLVPETAAIAATLPLSDSFMLIVDAVEGVHPSNLHLTCPDDRLAPLLFMNKIDRLFLELQLQVTEVQNTLQSVIRHLNSIRTQFIPTKNVLFGSGLHNWAFTIPTFAEMYAKKMPIKDKITERLTKYLWGDYFFVPNEKKWRRGCPEGQKNGFAQFIISPIYQIINAVFNDQQERLQRMLTSIQVTLSQEERELQGKPLLKAILRSWLPLTPLLLKTIIEQTPPPNKAQENLFQSFSQEQKDCGIHQSIGLCSASRSFIGFTTRQISSSNGGIYALGRVFSGVLKPGDDLFFPEDIVKNAQPSAGPTSRLDTLAVREIPAGHLFLLKNTVTLGWSRTVSAPTEEMIAFLMGTICTDSPVRLLFGCRDVLNLIYQELKTLEISILTNIQNAK